MKTPCGLCYHGLVLWPNDERTNESWKFCPRCEGSEFVEMEESSDGN